MKLLIYNWTFITKRDLYQSLREQKIEFDLFTPAANARVKEQQADFCRELEEALEGKEYTAIFSINYYDSLACAAHDRGILYICWTYDAPALGGLRDTHLFDTNRIFLFDSYEYAEFKKANVPNLYYLPLAVNVKKLNRMQPTLKDKLKYSADISLVGQLYQSNMDKILPLFDEYSAGYVSAIINTQLNIHDKFIIEEMINDNVVKRLCNEQVSEALVENMNNNFLRDATLQSSSLRMFLGKAVTNKERVLLLTLLAKYYAVKLYTPDKVELPNVKLCGIVDYETAMPLVFKCSKINLNSTLRTIRNGIPQRVFDILGCRGLVLTNYQKDLEEYFQDGRDLLIYHSVEEALDKCRYYLSHEKEAEQIRQRGYKIVKDKFSFEHQLNKIWELSGLKECLPK